MAEGGRKGVIWLLEGRYGRGWRRFAGELRQLLDAQIKTSGSKEIGGPSPVGLLLDASFPGVKSRRSFVEVLRPISGVEAGVACSSRSLDLFPVSPCFESKSDGVRACSVVDCSTMEGLPSSLVAAAGSVSSKKKRKGKFGIGGLMRLLGHFHLKLDLILARVNAKSIRRRKRVCVLGLDKTLGWAFGSVPEAGLEHLSVPDVKLGPNLDLASNTLTLGSSYGSATHPENPSALTLVSKDVLEPSVRSPASWQDFGLCPLPEVVLTSSLVELSLSPMRASGENVGFVGEGSA
jgi:hypothetical protein